MTNFIPIEPFDDEPTPKYALGPASLEDAMGPLEAILGERVIVFLRDDVDSENISIPLVPLPAGRLVRMLPPLMAGRPGTLLVSDGNMSHALAFNEAKAGRLIFSDPWHSSSFLQPGRNVAGVAAQSEGEGQYSVSAEELERVIVAQGVTGFGKRSQLVVSPTWDEFKQSDLYTFFRLRPDGDRVPLADGFALPHKPGGFREFLNVDFELDQSERLRAGVIEVQQDWLRGAGRPFGMDLLKSFTKAVVTRTMDLSSLGVADDPVVPCPDLHLTDALVDVFRSLEHGRRPAPSPRVDRLTRLFAAIAGQSEQEQLFLHFHGIRVVNRNGFVLMRIERLTD